jgi:hypothetical protein
MIESNPKAAGSFDAHAKTSLKERTMKYPHSLVSSSLVAVLLAAGGSAVLAASPPRTASVAGDASTDNSTYQQELAVCGHNQQDRAACIREAGAARQQAARDGLRVAGADYRQNALARCSLHTAASERAACEARVTGTGDTTVDGSVLGGGLIRETVTPVPAPMYAPLPGPMYAPMPARMR